MAIPFLQPYRPNESPSSLLSSHRLTTPSRPGLTPLHPRRSTVHSSIPRRHTLVVTSIAHIANLSSAPSIMPIPYTRPRVTASSMLQPPSYLHSSRTSYNRAPCFPPSQRPPQISALTSTRNAEASPPTIYGAWMAKKQSPSQPLALAGKVALKISCHNIPLLPPIISQYITNLSFTWPDCRLERFDSWETHVYE